MKTKTKNFKFDFFEIDVVYDREVSRNGHDFVTRACRTVFVKKQPTRWILQLEVNGAKCCSRTIKSNSLTLDDIVDYCFDDIFENASFVGISRIKAISECDGHVFVDSQEADFYYSHLTIWKNDHMVGLYAFDDIEDSWGWIIDETMSCRKEILG